MDQRMSLITLGVVDLARARRFYEEGLGWQVGLAVEGEVVFFQLKQEFGERVALDMVIKNNDGSKQQWKTDIDSIDG